MIGLLVVSGVALLSGFAYGHNSLVFVPKTSPILTVSSVLHAQPDSALCFAFMGSYLPYYPRRRDYSSAVVPSFHGAASGLAGPHGVWHVCCVDYGMTSERSPLWMALTAGSQCRRRGLLPAVC
jgi:hypothetical protein